MENMDLFLRHNDVENIIYKEIRGRFVINAQEVWGALLSFYACTRDNRIFFYYLRLCLIFPQFSFS